MTGVQTCALPISSKRKIWLGFQESVFLKNLGGKHFPEVVKILEMSLFADYIKFDPQTFDCYIYFLFWIFIFQFYLLKFYFYINFGLYFYNCYLLFSFHFYWNFLSIRFDSHFFITTYFIWNNLWNVDYYYFNFFIFNFLDLISIILIIIYFIWDNLWNYFFFQFHSHLTF